jgi:hypothetical protein
MKVRYTLGDDGIFRDRNGGALGRITSITIDLDQDSDVLAADAGALYGPDGDRLGGEGVGAFSSSGEQPGSTTEEAVVQGGAGGKSSDTEIVAGIWAYYIGVTKRQRVQLNPVRRTIIRQALKVRSVEEVKWAIYGLSISPHHNGRNDERKTYLDIRYALAGVSKGESNDERIDKMAALGRAHTGAAQPGAALDDPKVKRRLELLRENHAHGGDYEPTRTAEARRELEEWGYEIVTLDSAPWIDLRRKA